MAKHYTPNKKILQTSVFDFTNHINSQISEFVASRQYHAIKALREFGLSDAQIAKKLNLPVRQSVKKITDRWEAK